MKKLEERIIQYIGYEEPGTVDEMQIEIMGLKEAVKKAELRIAQLNVAYVVAVAEEAEAIEDVGESPEASMETEEDLPAAPVEDEADLPVDPVEDEAPADFDSPEDSEPEDVSGDEE